MRLSFGCVLGVPLATASLRFLIHLAPVDVPRLTEAGVDIHAMHRKQATRQALQHCPQCASCTISRWPKLFSASLAFISGVLVGGLNALQVLRHSPREVLSNASRNTAGRQRTWLRSSLVVSQVALAIILVSGAGLMLRTFPESALDQYRLSIGRCPVRRHCAAAVTIPTDRTKGVVFQESSGSFTERAGGGICRRFHRLSFCRAI